MKFWTEESVFSDDAASADVRRIASEVLGALDDIAVDGFPRLVRIGKYDDEEEDLCRYDVMTELAPGLMLPTEYGTIEGVAEGYEQEGDEDQVLEWVMEGVEACQAHLDRLSEVLHQARVRVRQAIGEWADVGVQSRLIDVHLAPYDHWRGSFEPRIRVLLEGLDERLQPSVEELSAEIPAELKKELSDCREGLEVRMAERAEIARLGASGWVSQLALNAMAQFGDTAETLRRFANEWRFWLPDSTALLMRCGFVTAGNGTANPTVHWGQDSITVDGLFLPETLLVASIGRPVTEVFQHDFLSDDMLVVDTDSSFHDGRVSVTFRLTIPQRLFCSITGRVWDAAVDTPHVGETTDTANVVPFRSRAR